VSGAANRNVGAWSRTNHRPQRGGDFADATIVKWRQRKLGDVLEIKHGFAFKGEFFSDAGELVLLTPGNFKEEGGLKLKGDKEKHYTGEFPDEYLLRRGDLLVAMTDLTQNAPILGSPAFIPEDGRFLHNQRLGKIVNLKTDEALPEFVFYLFNMASVRDQIRGSASGATVRHTSPSRIYDVSVKFPPLPLQRRIARQPVRQTPAKQVEVGLVANRRAERPGNQDAQRLQAPLGHQGRGGDVRELALDDGGQGHAAVRQEIQHESDRSISATSRACRRRTRASSDCANVRTRGVLMRR